MFNIGYTVERLLSYYIRQFFINKMDYVSQTLHAVEGKSSLPLSPNIGQRYTILTGTGHGSPMLLGSCHLIRDSMASTSLSVISRHQKCFLKT